MRILLASVLMFGLSGLVHASESKYQIENGIKIYRFGPNQTDIAIRNVRAQNAIVQKRQQAKRARHMAAKTKYETAIKQAAYQKGHADGFADALKTQPVRQKRVRPKNRRYSTYLGLSPYNRRAFRGLYGRPVRARTATYIQPRR